MADAFFLLVSETGAVVRLDCSDGEHLEQQRGIGVACVAPGNTDDRETPEELLQVLAVQLQSVPFSIKKKKKKTLSPAFGREHDKLIASS